MENMSYSDWHGDTSNCPYLNNTLLPLGVAFSGWACVSNYGLSLPNYLDATGGSNQSVVTDGNPPSVTAVEPSVFSLVEAANLTWKSYQMSYASVGTPQSSTLTDGDGAISGLDGSNNVYVEHHCPAMYYTAIRSNGTRCQNIDDFTRLTNSAGADFDSASLAKTPNFAWIAVDNDHNMHNGTSSDAIADCKSRGDTELSNLIPILRGSFAYLNRKCLIIVWWDEGRTGVTDPGVIFVGSSGVKTNQISSTAHNHYATLATIEWALDLGNCGRGETHVGVPTEAFL